MHNKRRTNNMNGGGGQHRHNNNRPRRFNNNRPQHEGGSDPASVSRTRRNATQSREKYQMMARDAQSSGDRVLAEYYLQHADHYFRVLLALPPEEVRQPYNNPRPYNAQNGEHSASDQPQDGQSHDGHAQHNPAAGNHGTQEQASAEHALPSFITQPLHSEEPREQ